MGYLTKSGTLWGAVPQTHGRVLWVAPSTPYTVDGNAYDASDGNDGLSPERALSTINRAIVLANASVGEVIMLLPGSHTDSVTVTLNKAGLTFVGCHPAGRMNPYLRPNPLGVKVNWTSTFAGTAVTNTAADNTFIGINMIPVTARTFMTCIATARTQFIECLVTLSAAASTSTKGIVYSGAAGDLCGFNNCTFLNTIGAQGPAIDLTGTTHFLVDRCTFIVDTGTWAVALLQGTGQGIYRDCDFVTGVAGVMTVGISGTGATTAKAAIALRNQFGVSPGAGGISLAGAGTYIELVENRLATVSGGTGSTLLTTNS